ncbi:metallo-beta-lactamase [Salinisphaera dokdonensis CL-ES53]|uniref:Metallo-beta-lactamase n=1 Tax=Salinisphaera dokdonensis CL-ES53 TaxID=1304272 RepID=A0ABV2B3Q4_9GAMM
MRITYWLAALAVLSGTSSVLADDVPQPLRVSEVAQGVFVHLGDQAEANRGNAGDIANIGFIVGDECVAVIDTGGTPQIGARLRAAISEQTATPVCCVINTHMHPDHVLGNRAFAADDTTFIAAAGFDSALAARSESYLTRMPETIGITADSSWIVLSDRQIDGAAKLDLGGREVTLQSWPTAHTDNDLTVYDEDTGTLWTGDLLFVDRVPSIDGSITGWLQVLDRLAENGTVGTVVPGHGPVKHDLARATAPERRYLETIRDDVRKAIADGYGLQHAVQHTGTQQRSRWLLFDAYHARNVTAAYTELEWE